MLKVNIIGYLREVWPDYKDFKKDIEALTAETDKLKKMQDKLSDLCKPMYILDSNGTLHRLESDKEITKRMIEEYFTEKIATSRHSKTFWKRQRKLAINWLERED